MCGICGLYFKKTKGDCRQSVTAMTEALNHRGPDAGDTYYHPRIGLGHRRLSIIDLDEKANQPFASSDKRYQLVFNGEIYNFKTIKEELKSDYDFKTHSDTEVVLAAFLKWGKTCLERFEGMFAFAVWDSVAEELFIARDRLGIKPVYYFQDDNQLLFSSEIRSLIKSKSFEPKLDKDSVFDFLSYQTVHAPYTILQDVLMLMPGHFMEVKKGDFNIAKWWQPEGNQKHQDSLRKAEWQSLIKDQFFSAVEKRMMADVPLGAFLSGGIDSSAIVAAMSEISDRPVSTFSVVFDEAEFSEDQYSQLVTKKFNTDHHRLLLKPDDFLENIPAALKAMDHPSGDGINTYTVSEATKKAGITVALSGLGGDELFAGYPVFSQIPKLQKFNAIPAFMRRGLAGLLAISSSQKAKKGAELFSKKVMELQSLYPEMRRLISQKELTKLMDGRNNPCRLEVLTRDIHSETNISGLRTWFLSGVEEPASGLFSKLSSLEIQTYLQNVLLRDADQFSMAHALEVRVPFLDHKLVELMLKVPDQFKQGEYPKQLLVESLGDRIPREVYDRKKMGFVFPWKEWLKADLSSLVKGSLEMLKENPLFSEDVLDKISREFYKKDLEDRWITLWNLTVLNQWMQNNGIEN